MGMMAAAAHWCLNVCAWVNKRLFQSTLGLCWKVLHKRTPFPFCWRCVQLFSDLSGKAFLFPQETNSAYVKLTASLQDFGSLTVCHRCRCHDFIDFLDQQLAAEKLHLYFAGPSLIWSGTMPSSLSPRPSTPTACWSSGTKPTVNWSRTSRIKRQNTGVWTTSPTCGTPSVPPGTPRPDWCRCGSTVNPQFGDFQSLVRISVGTPSS